MMKKTALAGQFAGAGALAIGLTMGVLVSPAHADGWDDGPAGQLTLWQNDGYEGQAESRHNFDNDFGNDECSGCDFGPGGDFEDDASSVANRTLDWWVLAEDDDQGGTKICIRPTSHDGDLGAQLEDEISSVERRGRTRPATCDAVIGTPN